MASPLDDKIEKMVTALKGAVPSVDRVSLRDLREEDIPHLRRYWFDSPPEYLEAMGVDPKKLPPQEKFEIGLLEKCRGPSSKLNALIILFDDHPVGFHTINPLVEDDYGIFHAHIWDSQFRRKGIASISYPKACWIFFRRFGLKRILFKTPTQNTGSIRVKEKLGIRYIGDETVGFGIVKDGTLAKVFELTREESDFLIEQMEHPEVDLNQIQRNLSLSVDERLYEHQKALNLALDLQEAGKKMREQSQ